MKTSFLSTVIAVALACFSAGCTVTLGRSIEAATVNINEADSHALNIASPNASNISREVSAAEGATAPVFQNLADNGSSQNQDKPITADAALLDQIGSKGTAGAQKDSQSNAEGGSDAIDVSPDVNVSPTGL